MKLKGDGPITEGERTIARQTLGGLTVNDKATAEANLNATNQVTATRIVAYSAGSVSYTQTIGTVTCSGNTKSESPVSGPLSLPDAEEIRRAGGALFSDLGPGFGKAAFSTAESTSGGPDPAGGSERHTPK
jgi:hypothetical protein